MSTKPKWPTWKKLRLSAILLPLITAAFVALMFVLDDKRADDRTRQIEAAKAAGYEEIATFIRSDAITVDGVEYEYFRPSDSAWQWNRAKYNALIEKGASYRDDSKGNKGAALEIYGRELRRLSDDQVVIDPYYICLERTGNSLITLTEVLCVVILAAVAEIILVLAWILCYGKYRAEKIS